MTYNIISCFQYVFFIGFLHRITVVNDIRDTVLIPVIGYDSDMMLEDYDISTLPFFGLRQVCSKADGSMFQIYMKIRYTAA